MKTLTRTKVVEYQVFQTSDGKEFENRSQALAHEDELQGNRKNCSKCKGSGKINERYERTWIPGMIPTSGEYEMTWTYDKCPECRGKGYFERKWV